MSIKKLKWVGETDKARWGRLHCHSVQASKSLELMQFLSILRAENFRTDICRIFEKKLDSRKAVKVQDYLPGQCQRHVDMTVMES